MDVNFFSVLAAAVLLALEFACSKFYQSLEGVSVQAGLRYNAVSGGVSALIMWTLSGFRPEWTVFSVLLALGMALCSTAYTLLCFRILNLGGMALYSTFLMCGGMLLPYIFGILFLGEAVTPLRTLGLTIVLAAVILSNFSKQAISSRLLMLCIAVFILNGLVSILSKCHQITGEYAAVSSAAFVMYSGIGRCLFSLAALVLRKQRTQVPSLKSKLSLWVIVGAAIISALSYLLQLNGARVLPASVLYPFITGGSIIFSAIAGRVFFQEHTSRRRLGCIILCIIGTLLFL